MKYIFWFLLGRLVTKIRREHSCTTVPCQLWEPLLHHHAHWGLQGLGAKA